MTVSQLAPGASPRMKHLTPWYLAAIAPIAVASCSGTMLGHIAVVAVTFGIFFGTLGLGRAPAVSKSSAAKVVVPTTETLEG